MRNIKYKEAISEAIVSEMEANQNIFLAGIAVDYPSGIFGTTTKALERFGAKRVFDVPAMENAITGIAIGAAAMGKRPILVHPRVDFMFLSFDMLIQLGAKWKYMFGGNGGEVPIVIRAIIGRGWGQGSTHSQSIQAPLAHFPGLTVLMPAFPVDAKGLMISALRHSGPVVILEYRTLYDSEGPVPEESYITPIGKAAVIRKGDVLTIVGVSLMAVEALHAAQELSRHGISVEVIDLRSIRPLDEDTIIESVRKTGRLLVVDTSWELCGVSSEIAALVSEKAFESLKAPVRRLAVADCPCPVSEPIEKAFYPTAKTIVDAVISMMKVSVTSSAVEGYKDNFKGPY